MRAEMLALAAALATAAPAPAGFERLATGHAVRPAPAVARPALHVPFTDPVFGARVTRVTDASQAPGTKWVRHYYAKTSPWNADGTLALLIGSDGRVLLYDAVTWKPIRSLRVEGSDPEMQWHPTDPAIFYFVGPVTSGGRARAFYRYDVRRDAAALLHEFTEYDEARGRFEGNLDAAGRLYAMVGWKGKEPAEALLYDLQADAIVARVPVTPREVEDWISVSPSGRYVVAVGKDRARIYDARLRLQRELPPGSIGHGDLCRLADGTEAFVYDGSDHQLDANRNINIASLETGRVTIGVRIGWGTTPHVSCRNLDLPGWALVSTQGPDKAYPNHDFEIFWLRLDGSGEVRRVAHHHSLRSRSGYFAEAHAVADRTGRHILFASNWDGDDIDAYVVDLPAAGPR